MQQGHDPFPTLYVNASTGTTAQQLQLNLKNLLAKTNKYDYNKYSQISTKILDGVTFYYYTAEFDSSSVALPPTGGPPVSFFASAVKNDVLYEISYTDFSGVPYGNEWSEEEKTFNQILSTFKFSDQTSQTIVTSTPDQTVNWKIYTNSTYGYSLKYPSNWKPTILNDNAQSFEKESYIINFSKTINKAAVGGASYYIVAKSEPIQFQGQSLLKVYIKNNDESCIANEQPTVAPPDQCHNAFNEIILLPSTAIQNFTIGGVNVPEITRSSLFSGMGNGYNTDFVVTGLNAINISDIATNPFVSTYNQVLSTFKFTQ
jgi:hypothetical protein